MASNSQGIQTLLDAEQEAAKVVSKARDYRNQRIKDARSEASKEIEQLKSKKEAEFKEFEQQHSGDNKTAGEQVDKETSEQLEKLKQSFEKNRQQVVKDLLDRVVSVEPKLHKNFVKPSNGQKASS